jgi:hypothetical protein
LRFFQSSFVFVLTITALFSSYGQQIFNHPLSSRVANYKIQVRLDTDSKTLYGQQWLHWRNDSNVRADELQFHLYMNGFRSKSSSFMASMSERRRNMIEEDELGSIEISRFVIDDDTNLIEKIEYIQPDDANLHDSSLIRVPLSKPVMPGDTTQIEIEFSCRLPRIIARTGYVHTFYMLGQWFPKIGVFEEGRWNSHQFFRQSEFFADFGVYDVTLSLPKNFVVGATGQLIKEEVKDSLKTLHFRAEDVHDFAITAWPDYEKMVKNINGVDVVLLYVPEHKGKVDRYFNIIEASLNFTAKWLMPYPYPQLTVVDVPLFAYEAGGMEYPTLITCASVWGIPENIRFYLEEYTVHEFVHQYFYGILASNESEEPWMDEGFTSYATQKILSHVYGLNRSASTFLNILVGAHDFRKKGYMRNPDRSITVKPSWKFKPRSYGVSTYNKPMLILQTLENYQGTAMMDSIMAAYIKRWGFKHPRTENFIDIVQEYTSQDMQWFFQSALFDSSVLDYSVEIIRQQQDSMGSFQGSEIVVSRRGDFIFPVEIEYQLAKGHTVLKEWDGIDSVYTLFIPGPEPVVSAKIDPQQKIWLDINWTNNSFTLKDNSTAFFRHWMKSLKISQQILLGLFSF